MLAKQIRYYMSYILSQYEKEWATLHLLTSSAPTTLQLVLAKSVRKKLIVSLPMRIN